MSTPKPIILGELREGQTIWRKSGIKGDPIWSPYKVADEATRIMPLNGGAEGWVVTLKAPGGVSFAGVSEYDDGTLADISRRLDGYLDPSEFYDRCPTEMQNPITPRKSIEQFGIAMEQEIRDNEPKGSWDDWTPEPSDILREIDYHTRQLRAAYHAEDQDQIAEHAADLANFAMKAWETHGKR